MHSWQISTGFPPTVATADCVAIITSTPRSPLTIFPYIRLLLAIIPICSGLGFITLSQISQCVFVLTPHPPSAPPTPAESPRAVALVLAHGLGACRARCGTSPCRHSRCRGPRRTKRNLRRRLSASPATPPPPPRRPL